MARSRKGLPPKGTPRAKALVQAAITAPIVDIQKAQQTAAKLRPDHPTLSDDQVALVMLKVTTQESDRQIALKLKCSHHWISSQLVKPAVQAFMAELALASLGVAASRGIQTLGLLAHKSKDEGMRFRAAQALMDRAGMGNSTGAVAQGSAGYSFTFAAPKVLP